MLLADGPFRRSIQRSCRHLLVDEFQDLTPAHVLLVRLLALPALDVFGVGDDDQCIYGHAGADPAFLIDYDRLFPGAVPHPLTVNYRCPVEVVDGARTLLGYNHRRVAKQIDAGPGQRPVTRTGCASSTTAATTAPTALVTTVRGWLGEDGVEHDVDRRALACQLVAPRAARRAPRGRRAGLVGAAPRRPRAHRACAPRSPTCASPRPATRWRPTTSSRSCAGRRAACRSGSRIASPAASRWSLAQLAGLADQVPDKDAPKVLRLVDDLRVVVDAGRAGTTRHVLEAVRDDVGLGAAMSLLDRTGGGQGSSHLDDIDGLLGVADLHPDPGGFEPWLRAVFKRETDPAGVTLSTVHRVKGREWDRVAVFGVADGIVPHRLAEDEEEERRVLHVAITRGRHRVDRPRRSQPAEPVRRRARRDGAAPSGPTRTQRGRGTGDPEPARVVDVRLSRRRRHRRRRRARVRVQGGYDGVVEDADGRSVVVRLDTGATLRVRFGERVEHAGRRAPLAPPATLWGPAAAAETALRAWRSARSSADGVPAYIVVNDKHLRGIALARPSTPGRPRRLRRHRPGQARALRRRDPRGARTVHDVTAQDGGVRTGARTGRCAARRRRCG